MTIPSVKKKIKLMDIGERSNNKSPTQYDKIQFILIGFSFINIDYRV